MFKVVHSSSIFSTECSDTLNARKSCADSILKIKTNDSRAIFSRNPQNSGKFDSET